MTNSEQGKQLQAWRNEFGNQYTDRNALTPQLLRARIAMWSRLLSSTIGAPPQSILEVGANVGTNLHALKAISGATLHAVEHYHVGA